MADHLTREEMRRDEVGEALERGVDYVATNWKRILTGAALLGLAVVFGLMWMQARARAAERASYALTQAIDELRSTQESAAGALDQVIDEGGAAGRIARLYRATLPEADADGLWEQAVDEPDAVTLVARINQLARLRQAGSYDQALELLEGENTGLPEDLRLYQTALTLTEAGRDAEATPLVEQLVSDYPASPWTAEARARQAAG